MIRNFVSIGTLCLHHMDPLAAQQALLAAAAWVGSGLSG